MSYPMDYQQQQQQQPDFTMHLQHQQQQHVDVPMQPPAFPPPPLEKRARAPQGDEFDTPEHLKPRLSELRPPPLGDLACCMPEQAMHGPPAHAFMPPMHMQQQQMHRMGFPMQHGMSMGMLAQQQLQQQQQHSLAYGGSAAGGWTLAQDGALREAVALARGNWKRVSAFLARAPGPLRTAEECVRRWTVLHKQGSALTQSVPCSGLEVSGPDEYELAAVERARLRREAEGRGLEASASTSACEADDGAALLDEAEADRQVAAVKERAAAAAAAGVDPAQAPTRAPSPDEDEAPALAARLRLQQAAAAAMARCGSDSEWDSDAESEWEVCPPYISTPNREDLPSVGSAGHHSGTCRRCCFHAKGRCLNGYACNFCHFDHEKRKRKNKSKNKNAKKRAKVAVAAALVRYSMLGINPRPPMLSDHIPRSAPMAKPMEAPRPAGLGKPPGGWSAASAAPPCDSRVLVWVDGMRGQYRFDADDLAKVLGGRIAAVFHDGSALVATASADEARRAADLDGTALATGPDATARLRVRLFAAGAGPAEAGLPALPALPAMAAMPAVAAG